MENVNPLQSNIPASTTQPNSKPPMSKFVAVIIIILVLVGAVSVYVAINYSRCGFKIFGIEITANCFEVNSFQDCVAAGYPVMESYPRRCNTPDGKNFVEDINQTRDWQTYRNDEYGFEFKYPRDWHYMEDTISSGEELNVLLSPTEINLLQGGPTYFSISIPKQNNQFAMGNSCQKLESVDGSINNTIFDSVYVAGRMIDRCLCYETGVCAWSTILDVPDRDKYEFICWNVSPNDPNGSVDVTESDPRVCDAVLSTFRFTK